MNRSSNPHPQAHGNPQTYSHSRSRAYSRPVVAHYGPASGSIPRELGDGPLAMAADAGPRPGVDAMKEATFFDPYEASEGHWDYGLLLSGRLPIITIGSE